MEIIAEIGQNHNGDMQLAHDLILAAKENGADVAKFQLYDAVNLFPPADQNEWFDYNCKTELSREQLEHLVSVCNDVDIEFMASAFDTQRIRWLDELGVQRHKLASRSINDQDLITGFIQSNKPLLASLGMWKGSSFPPIDMENVFYLYCVSQYPAPLNSFHLASIDFSKYAGLSDHSIGISAAVTALARGATIVEKHFTLDKSMYGPDHAGSMSPDELCELNKYRLDLELCL